jgi:hypothetical protein
MSSIFELLPCRFWKKVNRTDSCWLWEGACTRKGYGEYWHKNKVRRAHRVVWEVLHGQIPENMQVCHHCDTPGCVNPHHLFLGTGSDNAVDREQKGRGRPLGGTTHWTKTHPDKVRRGTNHPYFGRSDHIAGERNPSAVLTWEHVRAIRAMYAAGNTSCAKLAQEYGVGASTIHRVVRGHYWREGDSYVSVS